MRKIKKNMKKHRDNQSGYKGVSWHKKAKKWASFIRLDGKTIYLGLFMHKIEAAKTYNNAALPHFGEFAKLNVLK